MSGAYTDGTVGWPGDGGNPGPPYHPTAVSLYLTGGGGITAGTFNVDGTDVFTPADVIAGRGSVPNVPFQNSVLFFPAPYGDGRVFSYTITQTIPPGPTYFSGWQLNQFSAWSLPIVGFSGSTMLTTGNVPMPDSARVWPGRAFSSLIGPPLGPYVTSPPGAVWDTGNNLAPQPNWGVDATVFGGPLVLTATYTLSF